MRKPFAIIMSACLLLISCEKEIDFRYRHIDPLTVIEANLTETSASVIITETTDVDEPMDRTRYTDATVTLTDMTEGSSRQLLPDSEGVFTYSGLSGASGSAGIPGHSYRLDVERGGWLHTSECEMLRPADIVDFRLYRIKPPMMDMIVAQVTFLDNNPLIAGDSYIVRFFRNGEIFSVGTITDIQAVGGVLVTSINVPDTRDFSESDFEGRDHDDLLWEGDELTVTVVPAPARYLHYLVALNQGSNGPLMYETKPLAGTRPASGEDFCLGYFLTAPETSRSVIIRSADIPDYKALPTPAE